MRLLCKLGIHDWIYSLGIGKEYMWRDCLWCDKRQTWAETIGKWV